MSLNEMIKEYGIYAKDKGFWDKVDINKDSAVIRLCLIHSEVSEALDAYRDGLDMSEEIADIVIRVFDFCYRYNIDLETAIKDKMKINYNRPKLHGRKVF